MSNTPTPAMSSDVAPDLSTPSVPSDGVPRPAAAAVLPTDDDSQFGNIDFSNIPAESIQAVESTAGLSYDHYISIPKLSAAPLLKVLEVLSKIASDSYAKNVHIISTPEKLEFKFNNDSYLLQFELPNAGRKVIPPVSLTIADFRKLFGLVSGNLILVQDGEELKMCIGDHLVFVDSVPFAPEHYTFDIDVSGVSPLDFARISGHLQSFTSLLGFSEKNSERILVTKDGSSYINVGAILGRAPSFFGADAKLQTHRVVLETLVTLLDAADPARGMNMMLSDGFATFEFPGFSKFYCAVTTGTAVDNFMSRMVEAAFLYKSSVTLNRDGLVQLLSVFGAMDYFTPHVNIQFRSKECMITAYKRDGSEAKYKFPYLSGTCEEHSINIEISMLLAVLSKASQTTKFGFTDGNLVIDLGDAIYCVRNFNPA